MEIGGKQTGRPRWRRLIGILIAVGLVIGGVAACQAIRASSPEYQCRDRGDTWVEGYTVDEPYCVGPDPIIRPKR
jgi:hypothetical protein